MTAATNGPGREPMFDRDAPPPEVWVVWGSDGVDFVAEYDFMAQEHANEYAELFPKAGPWRVHKYALAAMPHPDTNEHGIGPDIGGGLNPHYVPPAPEDSRIAAALEWIAAIKGSFDPTAVGSTCRLIRAESAVMDAIHQPAPPAAPPEPAADAVCEHDEIDVDTAFADGLCPLCLHATIEQQARELADWREWKVGDDRREQEFRDMRATIQQQARELAEWRKPDSNAQSWGWRNAAAWQERAERAEAERDQWRQACADDTKVRDGYLADLATMRAERDAAVAAIDAAWRVMHGEGVQDQGEAWDATLKILDAARGKP